MSAIANPRPSSRLTRAERMAELAASRTPSAPLYKVGDRVIFEGRASRVQDVRRSESGARFVTVAVLGGTVTVGEMHPDLVAE